jgi:hypothetical protein
VRDIDKSREMDVLFGDSTRHTSLSVQWRDTKVGPGTTVHRHEDGVKFLECSDLQSHERGRGQDKIRAGSMIVTVNATAKYEGG